MTELAAGTVFTLWRPAGTITVPDRGAVAQRFVPGSWDSRIGSVSLLYRRGQVAGAGKLLSAVVAPGGTGVHLTYEVLEV